MPKAEHQRDRDGRFLSKRRAAARKACKKRVRGKNGQFLSKRKANAVRRRRAKDGRKR